MFSHVRFEDSIYASYLFALCQGFPVRIITLMCKFSSFFFAPGLIHSSVPPCKDPSMLPHIQDLDALMMCRLYFDVTISLSKNTHCKIKCLAAFLDHVINLICPTWVVYCYYLGTSVLLVIRHGIWIHFCIY
jgi:hypothetical protein